MSWSAGFPVLVLATPLVTGLSILLLREEQVRARTVLNLIGATLKGVLVAIMLWGVFHEESYETRFPLVEGVDFLLNSDALSMLFATLSALLWLVTTFYAVGYLEGGPHQRRFFTFFSLCVTSTMGIALAGNPLTFLLFYELLTVSTWPLVVHSGTPEALRAGRLYLAYTLGGGALLFFAVAWLHALAGPVEFQQGGVLARVGLAPGTAALLFACFMAALGVKAALVPLHRWLPTAMVAPAPVSALLHAVAVVKAGAFGIVRFVYELFGVEYAASLGVMRPLAAVASFTILYGSVRALSQENLKRRLAWSTVSQVSYIVLGTAIVGSLSTVGALVHLVHQGLMKITLFFCAGSLSRTLGIHEVHELKGVGRRMPWTMAAFTVGTLGMIGAPPIAGFITKWYLGLGSLEAGEAWVLGVLAGSTALNAAYWLPLLKRAWFDEPEERHAPRRGRFECNPLLLFPSLTTAALSLGVGLLAGSLLSPLFWARLIAFREFYP
ncbi:MAG TPA: proton-conducting transporter membrane subunit [Myxococcaceae bacterium]|nr:proton-conducting transporter membrane subunit [Myxococcaceae bacterium]